MRREGVRMKPKKPFQTKEAILAANARCDAELARMGIVARAVPHSSTPRLPFAKGYIQRQKDAVRIHY